MLRNVSSGHVTDESLKPISLQRNNEFVLYRIGRYQLWFPAQYDPAALAFVAMEILRWRIYDDSRCPVGDDWVVDAGASEGLYSLRVLELGGKVLAVEPVPELADALERTLEPYIREGRARIARCALGSAEGQVELRVFPHNVIGSGLYATAEKERRAGGEGYTVSVPMRTLDALVRELGLESVSVIKADIEGAELPMLVGSLDTIGRHACALAICVYHYPDDWIDIPRFAQEQGYAWRFDPSLQVMFAWPVSNASKRCSNSSRCK